MKKPPEGLIFSRRDIFRIILPLVAEQFLAMFVEMCIRDRSLTSCMRFFRMSGPFPKPSATMRSIEGRPRS